MRLVVLGDSCSGVPGGPHEARLRQLSDVALGHAGWADGCIYLGDHVDGYCDPDTLRAQWRHFLEHELAPLAGGFAPILHVPSNHTVYDQASAAIYRQLMLEGEIPGLVLRRGLNHAVTLGDGGAVLLGTADPENRGKARIDLDFLAEALQALAGRRPLLVCGHHPMLPVNGYRRFPMWRVAPDAAEQALAMMRKAGVAAYLCSHVIAFDLQVADGLLQICTGGAGTLYGPGGAMPGVVEDAHLVLLELRDGAFAIRKLDLQGRLDEWLDWPVPPGRSLLQDETLTAAPREIAAPEGWRQGPDTAHWLTWRIAGSRPAPGESLPLVYAWREDEAAAILRIDIGGEGRPVLRLIPLPCEGAQTWVAPFAVPPGFEIEIAVHTGGGPGGILARLADGPWQSMAGGGARGAERMDWPPLWCAGRDPEISPVRLPSAPPAAALQVTFSVNAVQPVPAFPFAAAGALPR
ncbi:metallophosphoesterase family protein [Marinibaculum pumilum]|uniref:Metallophosphoesterase family protein n=1 Tax=Marinibaculum pumilum TaxID=1766165 RepID=A0ABV7KZT2_9PROT